jgi:hypothetical protein
MEESRQMITRLWTVCLAMFFLAGCGVNEDMKPQNISLAEWETVMEVKFPPESAPLGMQKLDGRDRLVRLKVTMPASQWPAFLESTQIDPEDLTDRARFFLGPDEDFWDPSAPPKLPTAQRRLDNGSVLNLGFHEDSPETVVVYLVWHET